MLQAGLHGAMRAPGEKQKDAVSSAFRDGRKRSKLEPRPTRQRAPVGSLARGQAIAPNQVAEPNPAKGRSRSASSHPRNRRSRPAATRPRNPRSRPETRRNAAFLEHGQGLPAQERSPTCQPGRACRPWPLRASLSDISNSSLNALSAPPQRPILCTHVRCLVGCSTCVL